MTSVFVKADPPEPEGLILLKPEPLDSVMGKWLAWILTLVLFLLGLIYFSTNFAKVEIPSVEKEYRVLDEDDYMPYLLSINRHTRSSDHIPHLDVGQDVVKSKPNIEPDMEPATPFPDTPESLIVAVNRPIVADDSVRTGFTANIDLGYNSDEDEEEDHICSDHAAPFTKLAIGGLEGYHGYGGRRRIH